MPGISVLTALRPASQDKANLAAEAARAANGFPHQTRTLLDTPAHQVVTTGYDGYPVTSFDAGAYWVCLEGRLYGKDESLCRAQPGRRCVLALSGGLDSRAVAAGLGSRGIDFSAMTYVDPDGVCGGDPPIAQRVAAVFHAEWRAVELCPPRGRHLLDVLALKRGMAWLHWAMLLQFLEAVREEYGAQVFLVTGDGGDKVLPGLRPGRRFDDVRALTRYLVAHNSVLGLNETAALTGISAEDILAEIDSLLVTYPEPSSASL